tara:strand:- start:158 stop:829 length:672 start_codon:yes stop_codon:yes gene_type:complete
MIPIMSKDIYTSVIKKPWGKEHCIYRGDDLSIWLLQINPDKKTSLHCHPRKKTGLILLNKTARIKLLEREFELSGLDKINLRNQQFHQTYNISDEPIFIVEVETPDNKTDLIRIDDDYGRAGKEFEDETEWDSDLTDLFIVEPNKINVFKNWNFEITNFSKIVNNSNLEDNSMIMLLSQNAFLSDDGHGLCDYGDVLNYKTVKFLVKQFNPVEDAKCILLWKR